MRLVVRLANVVDFEGLEVQYYHEEALKHAADSLGMSVESHWLPTSSLVDADHRADLVNYDGIGTGPGNPLVREGALRALQFARERNWPMLATCSGFATTLLEYMHDVMGIREAADTRENPDTPVPLIVPVPCPLPEQMAPGENRADPHLRGLHRMAGRMTVKVEPDSAAFNIYHKTEIVEEVLCNSGLNADLQYMFNDAGLKFTGYAAHDGTARIVELPGHRFFMATLYQPQLSSTADRPAPLMVAFLKAIKAFHEERVASGQATAQPKYPRPFEQAEREFLEHKKGTLNPHTREALELQRI
jgi:CTP synthase (UTP-ammonia lyase)